MKDPNNKGKLIIDKEAAAVVKAIFNMYVDGMGVHLIAQELNRMKILSPSAYKKSKGIKLGYINNTSSIFWSKESVTVIINRETYIEKLVQGKSSTISNKNRKKIKNKMEDWIRVPNTHEPIISLELWERAQDIRKKRTRPAKRDGLKHIFFSKLLCSCCGEVLHKSLYKTKNEMKPYFRCSAHYRSVELCNNVKTLNGDELNRIVLKEINSLLEKHYNSDLISFELANEEAEEKQIKFIQHQKRDLIKELEQKEKAVESSYCDKVVGIITQEQFISFNKSFENDIISFKAAIDRLDKEIKKLEHKNDKKAERAQVLNKYKQIKVLTREIIDEFIECIRVGIYDTSKNSRQIEIVWQF